MKKAILLLVIVITFSMGAQERNFQSNTPTDFQSVSFQLDPLGSINKEGLNSVFSYSGVDFDFLEWNLQVQTIFTSKYSNKGRIKMDYLDIQIGPGILLPINERMSVTGGFHWGFIYRPKNNIIDADRGGMIYGFTGKFRAWLGCKKRFALVLSTAYDHRPDLMLFRLNTRGGIEFRFD